VDLAVVAKDSVEDLEREVPSFSFSLDLFQEPDTLDIVKKMTQSVFQGKLGEKPLPVVPEGAVADVVAQGDGLNKIFVQRKQASAGPGDLGNELDVQNAVGDMVVLDQVKNLGLVNVAGIGVRMKNAVCIQRKALPVALRNRGFLFFAKRIPAPARPRRKPAVFGAVQPKPDLSKSLCFAHLAEASFLT